MQPGNPYEAWGVDAAWLPVAEAVEAELKASPTWARLDALREANQLRVLAAFRHARISEVGFAGTTGYGYDDLGRERLEAAFAEIMGAEAALCRVQISSGTSAIALALYGCLRPGDLLLSATGSVYDTLDSVIGGNSSTDMGSLRDFGIEFRETALAEDGGPDLVAIETALRKAEAEKRPAKMLYIQRSRGYSARRALLQADVRAIVNICRRVSPGTIIFADNCYSEFTDYSETPAWGVDLAAGSLIKNPGGGLAPSGGYVCGRADLVEKAACRLNAPGLGSEVGPSLGFNRALTQGLYLAPHVVNECLRGLGFAAALAERYGLETSPDWRSQRGDIIQTFTFRDPGRMLAFCSAVQAAAAVDAYVEPIPSKLPGYSSDIVMAAGAFVQGSSIELSADGPMCEPYRVYMQGGLLYEQLKLAALLAFQKIYGNPLGNGVK